MDGTDHLLHTFRQLLHVFVGRGIGLGVPQVRLNILYRSHLLRPSSHGAAQNLEIQFGKSQLPGKGVENPVSAVPDG
jgi:hypothetical protein